MENGDEMLMSKMFLRTSFGLQVQVKDRYSCGFTPRSSRSRNLHIHRHTKRTLKKTFKMVGLWLMFVNTERQKGKKRKSNIEFVLVPAISGFSVAVMGFPFPIGALTKSRNSASG